VAQSATCCKVGSPAHLNNCFSFSTNAARCGERGTESRPSRSSEIVVHRLTTSTRTPPAEFFECFPRNADSVRHGQTSLKACGTKIRENGHRALMSATSPGGHSTIHPRAAMPGVQGPRIRTPRLRAGRHFESLKWQDMDAVDCRPYPAAVWLLSLSTCVSSSAPWPPCHQLGVFPGGGLRR
jgi:hypothetical protein